LSIQYPKMGLVIMVIGLIPLLLLAKRFGAGRENFSF
jgi:hypothetical protein